MKKYDLTTCTERQSATSLFTGNPINQHTTDPLDNLFDEEVERFEDDLFEERHMMSQQEFNHRVREDQKL